MARWPTLLRSSSVLLALASVAGCPDTMLYDDDVAPSPCCFADGDVDADVDVDGDVDVDADSDMDADADSDADAMLQRQRDLAAFCDGLTGAYCLGERSCCDAGWSEQGVQLCREATRASCETIFGDSILSGRAQFDSAQADACWASIRGGLSRTCPTSGPGSAADVESCAGTFQGTVPIWETCTFSYECMDAGVRCIYDDPASSSGLCDVPPEEGWACVYDCADGLECRDGVCFRPDALDTDCTIESEDRDSCAQGTWCNAQGKCAGQLPVNAACETARACWSGVCNAGVCVDDEYDYCWPDA